MVNYIDSSRVGFLERLKEVTQEAVKDLILPTRIQKADEEQSYRAADVYLMRLPDSKSAFKKCPYILHQLITGKDIQEEGQNVASTVQVRTIFCVYNDDEQEGGLMLLGLAERLRHRHLADHGAGHSGPGAFAFVVLLQTDTGHDGILSILAVNLRPAAHELVSGEKE